MILEKDPQQEDFLQGRMLGNPYSSNEVGLGPLMRDVKNKICQGRTGYCKRFYVFVIFAKGDKFCDFQFSFLEDENGIIS